MQTQSYTLYELNSLVRSALSAVLAPAYWVQAEVAELRERTHCYMELVQNDAHTHTPIARAKANCWYATWQQVSRKFQRDTGSTLRPGMQVLLLVSPTFHEAYGFSYTVTDIDPTYTLGDMARRRQEILRQLREEGVFDLQRELTLPLFAQRVAVISSAGAAGYGDFCDQLLHNEYGLRFTVRLFPAVMQGQHVEESVIAALEQIAGQQTEWDAVVIIRGGGATADLACFDSYPLASCVAQFPLPVIVGIGHDRDTTVLDEVAHQRVKTPTAAAAFLIDHQLVELSALQSLCTTIRQLAGMQIQQGLHSLRQLTHALPLLFGKATMGHRHHTDHLAYRFSHASAGLLRAQSHRLDLLEQQTRYNDPQLQLNRGFSLTVANGHVVSDPSQLKSGDTIETRLARGSVHSTVTTIHPHPKDTKQ